MSFWKISVMKLHKILTVCIKGNITCKTYDVINSDTVYIVEIGSYVYQRHLFNISRIMTGRNLDTLTSHFRSRNHCTIGYTFF